MNDSVAGESLGSLVAVVGLDGAGKTTQVRALGEWLRSLGVAARADTSVSMAPVRQALDVMAHEDGLADRLEVVSAPTMRLISACSKLARVAPLRTSLGESADMVVLDRYTYCQYALAQAQGDGSVDFLRRLFRQLPRPDLTIFLDVDPREAARRIDARGIDHESVDFLHAFRKAYLDLPEFADFLVLDGNGTQPEVAARLRTALRERFPERLGGANVTPTPHRPSPKESHP